MAIDFLIFGLLLISFTINLLALGAFWVTPGLRTTANRFVINLLIVNLIGCFLLAPTLFLSGNYFTSSSIYEEEKTIQKITKNENHLSIIRNGGQIIEEEDIYQNDNDSRTREMFVRCNSSYCNEMTIDKSENRIVMSIEDFEREQFLDDQPVARPLHIQQTRSWSLDLAAALGALSVLLVVGDTWCAITDPLRYHSRISGLKAWILIAIIWILGILFGALSALRETVFETTIVKIHKTAGHNGVYGDEFLLKSSEPTLTIDNENINIETTLYNSIFSYSYFIVIILLPFGCVCGMYWRIISEARENGLRMRQNGSSPLLQSALNLSQHNNAHNNILCNQRSSISGSAGGGLQMRIDNINHQLAIQSIATQNQTHTQTQNTHTHTRRCSFEQDNILKSHLPTGIQTLSDNHHNYQYQMQSNGKLSYKTERNQNIMLTLSAASQEIKRNYSARQLAILDASQDINDSSMNSGIRQIQSTPNLHRPTPVRKNSLNSTCIETSPHHVLQIPTIHASPKALSYMTSIRHRLSNASSLFKYREESRAARISILVVIMFLVSYLPYGLLVLLEGRILNNFTHSTQVEIFVVLLGNISAPFIFAYRNKRVRRGVKRLFGLDARSKERRLQRNGGLSCGGSNKHSINVRRSTSKVSTYSVNSCKYLTPHPIANANCPNTIHPNSIYINNINNNNNSNSSNNNINNTTFQSNNDKSNNYSNNLPSIIKQDTIIEHIPLENDSFKNRSILKMFCYSSRKLGCVDNLPAEV